MSSLATNAITDASGGNTATINGQTPTESNMAGRNLIINGAMQVWQRGTSSSTNGYLADRWNVVNNTSASRQTDVPNGFQYSIEVGNSSASFPLILQRIEAANVQHLSGQAVTVSFWAKSISGSASLFVEFLTPSVADNFSSITNRGIYSWATPSTSWVKYTYTLTSVNAEVLNGLELRIGLQNQSAGTIRITGVQLEAGSVATPFERRLYGQELALCSRYFQTSYNDGVAVGTVTTSGGITNQAQANVAYVNMTWNFAVKMRANPTMTAYSTQTGTSGKFYSNAPAGDNNVSAGFLGASNATFATGTTSITATAYVIAHMTASAEL